MAIQEGRVGISQQISSLETLWDACEDLVHVTPRVRLTPAHNTLSYSRHGNSTENPLFDFIAADYGLQIVVPSKKGEIEVAIGGFFIDFDQRTMVISHPPQGIATFRQRGWLRRSLEEQSATKRYLSIISHAPAGEVLRFRKEFMEAVFIIAQALRPLGITRIIGSAVESHPKIIELVESAKTSPNKAYQLARRRVVIGHATDELYEAYLFRPVKDETGKGYYYLDIA